MNYKKEKKGSEEMNNGLHPGTEDEHISDPCSLSHAEDTISELVSKIEDLETERDDALGVVEEIKQMMLIIKKRTPYGYTVKTTELNRGKLAVAETILDYIKEN